MTELERTLERSRYRSMSEAMQRYGVPFCRLYHWRERGEPKFPPAIHVVGECEDFFSLLAMVRWEIDFQRRSRARAAQ